MKIIVFGARGDVGSRIVAEALSRRHQVTGVVRHKDQIADLPAAVHGQGADVTKTTLIRDMIADHDLAISAIRPPDGHEQQLVPLTRSLLDAAAGAAKRVLVVGGAASLRLPGGSAHTVLTAPGFLPASIVPIARACQAQYELCLSHADAEWSYLCPPAILTPGTRSGRYRTGADALLVDVNGASAISMEDFAVAMLDEAEAPQHPRARFTVAA